MQVHLILKSKNENSVFTVAPDETVSAAAKMLAERRIGSLVVSEDGRHVLGIVSERDIVRELGQRGESCLGDKVDDIMTREIVGCTGEDRADKVLQMMTDGHFRHMPVMEGDVMIGLISIGDVVKARLSELSMEKDALEGMIMGH